MKYRLVGYDQFSHEEYELRGAIYEMLEEARRAKLDRDQRAPERQYASPGFHDRTYIRDENNKVVG